MLARHRPDPLGGPAASARPRQQELHTIDHDFGRALGALTIAAAYLRSLLAEMDIAMRDAPDRPGPASTWSAYARELLEHAERVDAAIPTARFSVRPPTTSSSKRPTAPRPSPTPATST